MGDEELRAARQPALVSRQPIVDGAERVFGYLIDYAVASRNGPGSPPVQAIDVLDEVLTVLEGEEFALGARTLLPVSREMLLHHGDAPPVDRERAVLRVHYADMLDPAVVSVVAAARRRGYSFALDELSQDDFDVSLLRHVDVVELIPSRLGDGTLASLMRTLRLRNTPALAAGISSEVQRDEARSLGFRWFAGPFYTAPNLLGGCPVPIGNMQTLLTLSCLGADDVELDELIELIERDVGLGVRLLRYVGSPVFGQRNDVRSVRHAARTLGAAGLMHWAQVAASVGSESQIPREHTLLALSRARTCELLAGHRDWPVDADLLFTVGLLSAAGTMFSLPMGQVVAELSLTGPTGDALLHRAGPAGEILHAVLAHERGEVGVLSPEQPPGVSEAHFQGLSWAREALAVVPAG
jgi:EAL and modified HD-GYP domain-containing signal transduction protein